MFTSLNFIYRANEGSPTPKTGQSSLNTEAAHSWPPLPIRINPRASAEGLTAGARILPQLLGSSAGFRVESQAPPASLLAPEGPRREREAHTKIAVQLCNRNQVNCSHTLCLALNPHKHFVRQEILNPIHRSEKGGSRCREASQSHTVNTEWGPEPLEKGRRCPLTPPQGQGKIIVILAQRRGLQVEAKNGQA